MASAPNSPPEPRGAFGRGAALFAGLQLLTLLLVFRGALAGRELLAPLDLAPALLPEYRFLGGGESPTSNHYFYDQLVYDLPLQQAAHESWRRGEIPWWDPYTYGGRPLLADAHVSGTDPVRLLCFLLLPFEPAYNATQILHFVIAGAGLWLLLRRLGCDESIAVFLALAWEWSGGLTLKFGYPWLPAVFAWYPWLWLALHDASEAGRGRSRLGAVLACAAIFYSGNAQSHAYLGLFLAAWWLGCAARGGAAWRASAGLALTAAILGALLAAPVLVNELELFLLNVRPVNAPPAAHGIPWRAPWLTLAGLLHPWALGTFRTLDASKLGGIGLGSAGFNLFTGVLTLGGAVAWARRGCRRAADTPLVGGGGPFRTAAWLVAAYFVVLGTPLLGWLYTRTAGLGGLGLTVLGAGGLQWLRRDVQARMPAAQLAWVVAVLLTLSTHSVAFLLWPRIQGRVAGVVERDAAQSPLGALPALRREQIRRWPAETSFANPEPLLAVAGWAMLGGLLAKPRWRQTTVVWVGALALNLAPLVLFAARCIPHGDLALWRRLQEGGPDQRAVAAALAPHGERLWEPERQMRLRLFPGALGHLYGVRTLNGYAALRPANVAELAEPGRSAALAELGDAVVTLTNGAAVLLPGRPDARFRLKSGRPGAAQFTQRGLNGFRLQFAEPASGELLWTDTRYPGWSVLGDGRPLATRAEPPCFTDVLLDRPVRTLEFRYRPAHLALGLGGAAVGLAGAVGFAFRGGRLRGAAASLPPPRG